MRKVTMIRFGLAAALATIGLAGTFAIGCSGDDDDNGQPKTDASADSHADTSPAETGADTSPPGDSGGDAADAAVKDVKLVIAHVSPGLGAFRMCFGTGAAGTVAPLNALPDSLTDGQKAAGLPYPGVFPGTGGVLPKFPIDPSQLIITPYLVFADKVADQTSATPSEKTCIDLLGATGAGGTLQPNAGFLKLPAIPAGTFTPGHTYLLSILGCLPAAVDDGGSTLKCGSDYTAAGNVSVGIATLDNAPPAAGSMGFQFAHRSSAIEGELGLPGPQTGTNGVVLAIVAPDPAPDAGAAPDGGDDSGADAAPPSPTFHAVPLASSKFSGTTVAPPTAVAVPGVDKDKTPLGLFVPNPDGGAPPMSNIIGQPLPLNVISLLSTGVTPTSLGGDGGATMFVDGMNYTFVLTGDPTKPAPGQAGYNGQGPHILAFPNDPVVPALQTP